MYCILTYNNAFSEALNEEGKYKNLTENPSVSLLIDSREIAPRSRAQALTVEGSFHNIMDDAKQSRIKELLINRHPHLADFIDHPEAENICIKIGSFLLLNGLGEAHYEEL